MRFSRLPSLSLNQAARTAPKSAMSSTVPSNEGDSSDPVREGRRLAWIDKALEPAAGNVDARSLRQLRTALAVVVGVEPVLALRDICRLGPKAIEDTLVWTATSLVRQAGVATGRR